MFGSDILYTALNVTNITDLLDSFGTGKALFSDNLIPQSFTGDKSINFYMTSPFNCSMEYNDYRYTINCRASTYNESRTIAEAVKDEINRSKYANSFMVVSILGTIPPQDDTDNYNTPVEARIKGK
ncbi:MAG: hypothetical protein PVF17_00720 [Ignavibacteria bacterium]|jgi:hypothetical protein